MTPTATLVTLGALSLSGIAASAVLPQTADAPPWKDLAAGSSALLMFAALLYVLRFVSNERAAATAERAAAAKDAAAEREAAAKAAAEEREANRKHIHELIQTLRR